MGLTLLAMHAAAAGPAFDEIMPAGFDRESRSSLLYIYFKVHGASAAQNYIWTPVFLIPLKEDLISPSKSLFGEGIPMQDL